MGFYLLEHRNPHGDHFYTSRRKPLRVVVLHITAGLEDLDLRGVDVSAERTAAYAASTTRYVSWHGGSDSDSFLYLLPASYTAWHVQGYNSGTYGWEISKRDTTWSDEPKSWVEATLRHTAEGLRPIVDEYDIPLRLLTKKQVDAGKSGFVYHSTLDPARRTDPGKDFPIKRLFQLLQEDDMSQETVERGVLSLLKKAAGEATGEEDSQRGRHARDALWKIFRHPLRNDLKQYIDETLRPLLEAAAKGHALSAEEVQRIADAAAAAVPEDLAADVLDELHERLGEQEKTS